MNKVRPLEKLKETLAAINTFMEAGIPVPNEAYEIAELCKMALGVNRDYCRPRSTEERGIDVPCCDDYVSVIIDRSWEGADYANLTFVVGNGATSIHELCAPSLRAIATMLNEFADEIDPPEQMIGG